MLVIKVEIWPGGDADRAREIGRMGLANISNLAEDSAYLMVARDDRGGRASGIIRGHRRSLGFWALLSRAARLAGKGTNDFPERHRDLVAAVADRLDTETDPRGLKSWHQRR